MTAGGWGSHDPAPNDGRPDPSSWTGPGASNDRANPTSALPSFGGYQQPGYQPPGYQPPGYQPPGYQPPGPYQPSGVPQQPGGYPQPGAYQQPAAYGGRPSSRAPGTTGVAVASAGAAIAVLGLFLAWYASSSTSVGVKAIVRASKPAGAPGLFHLYFGWALWVVLAAAIAASISANLAGSAVAPLAVGGALVGVLSTVLTFAALNSGRSTGSPLDHAAIGLWLFLLGPLVLAAGSLAALARPSR